jgi:hypothetical protein
MRVFQYATERALCRSNYLRSRNFFLFVALLNYLVTLLSFSTCVYTE